MMKTGRLCGSCSSGGVTNPCQCVRAPPVAEPYPDPFCLPSAINQPSLKPVSMCLHQHLCSAFSTLVSWGAGPTLRVQRRVEARFVRALEHGHRAAAPTACSCAHATLVAPPIDVKITRWSILTAYLVVERVAARARSFLHVLAG